MNLGKTRIFLVVLLLLVSLSGCTQPDKKTTVKVPESPKQPDAYSIDNDFADLVMGSPCGGYGDLDNNDIITATDVILLNDSLRKPSIFTPEQRKRADMTADDVVDRDDLIMLQRFLLGKITNTSRIPACEPYNQEREQNMTREAEEQMRFVEEQRRINMGEIPP